MIRGDDLAPRPCEKRSLEGFYLTSLQTAPIQPRTVGNLSPMVKRTFAQSACGNVTRDDITARPR
jgi:hypothetical protein